MVEIPNYTKSLWQDGQRGGNAIIRYLDIPCAIPGAIYVEAAVPAIMGIVQDVMSLDPKEAYHKAFGHSLYHDVSNTFKYLAPVEQFSETPLGRTLFRLAGAFDYATWGVFVISAAVRGLVDWSDNVRRLNPCGTPHSPSFGQGGNYIDGISDDGNMYSILYSIEWGDGTSTAGPSGFVQGPNKPGFCAGTSKWEDFNNIPCPAASATVLIDSGMQMDRTQTDASKPLEHQSLHTWYKPPKQTTGTYQYQVQAACLQGGLPLHEMFGVTGELQCWCLDTSRT